MTDDENDMKCLQTCTRHNRYSCPSKRLHKFWPFYAVL